MLDKHSGETQNKNETIEKEINRLLDHIRGIHETIKVLQSLKTQTSDDEESYSGEGVPGGSEYGFPPTSHDEGFSVSGVTTSSTAPSRTVQNPNSTYTEANEKFDK